MIVLRGLLWVAWTYELLLLAVFPRPDLWSVGEDSRTYWWEAVLTALFTVRRLDVTWTTIWRDLYLNLRKNVHFDVPYGVLHLNSSVTVGYKSSNEIDSLIPPPISVTIASLGSKAAHTAGDRNHSEWLDCTRWEIEIGWRSPTELLVVDCKQCRYWCFL